MAATASISASASYGVLSKEAKAESENHWSAILNEVRASTSSRLVEKNLLVLGRTQATDRLHTSRDRESGRSSLLGRVIGKDQTVPSGLGLEHVCIPVKDDEREDVTQVNAWILEEEEYAASLLPLVLNAKTFDKLAVWIVISMTKPWSAMQSLDKWAHILSEDIDKMRLDPTVEKQYNQKLEKMFREYSDPTVAKATVGQPIERDADLPLGDHTLTANLGVPIIVVVTKADYMSVLEKDFDYREEKFDFIQMRVRNWCLKYGAGLVMTSAKENKNIELLHHYTSHVLYGLAFQEEGFVLERDAVFIPIGWDNEKKIGILHDSLGDIQPTRPFETVVMAPPTLSKQNAADMGIQAQDDQEFVKRIQEVLQQPVPSRLESPAGTPRLSTGSRPSATQGSPKKTDGPRGSLGAGGANESALSSFFNTLLNKSSKTPPVSAGRAASPSSVRVDAAAELERLTKSGDDSQESPKAAGESPDVQTDAEVKSEPAAQEL